MNTPMFIYTFLTAADVPPAKASLLDGIRRNQHGGKDLRRGK